MEVDCCQNDFSHDSEKFEFLTMDASRDDCWMGVGDATINERELKRQKKVNNNICYFDRFNYGFCAMRTDFWASEEHFYTDDNAPYLSLV